jgi:hypothetical protein
MGTLMAPSRNSLESCPPKYATRRRPERATFGGRLAKVADKLGQPFMPWQKYVADVGCEIDPDTGHPAYREVFVTIPRQSGKTTLFLSWQIDRCLNWSRPQRSVFTAQTGKDARDKWIDELFPLIRQSKLAPLVRQINQGMGNESITWKTGSGIRLASTSATSGHSKTLDQAVLDEIWHDVDDRREQGLRPAMITRPDAQLLVCSTAGTQASTVYNRKVEIGKASVLSDPGHGVAYFEWSAPADWDPADESSWWKFMPALGHTIGPEAIRAEREAMPPAEFKRAYGNVPTAGVASIIPMEVWSQVCDPDARPDGRLRFGLDVAEDRASASIAAYSGGVVELVDHRQGLDWCVARANELTRTHGGTVAIDSGGPAGSFADLLDSCEEMKAGDVVRACAAMYDSIIDGSVTFRSDPAFDAAVDGAAKRTVGDRWVWSRKASMADVTPLMAATLARASEPVDPALNVW